MLVSDPQVTEAPAMMHRNIVDALSSEVPSIWCTLGGIDQTVTSNSGNVMSSLLAASSGFPATSSSIGGGAPLQTAAVGVGALMDGVAILANI